MSLSEELLSGHRSVLDVDYLTQLYQKFPKLSLLEADPWQAASDHFAQSLQADSQLASMLIKLPSCEAIATIASKDSITIVRR